MRLLLTHKDIGRITVRLLPLKEGGTNEGRFGSVTSNNCSLDVTPIGQDGIFTLLGQYAYYN